MEKNQAERLRAHMREASVKCSERCLYQAAKWIAELSISLSPHIEDDGSDTEIDSPMDGTEATSAPSIIHTGSVDPVEARLESQEIDRYLLAKSFFDCREFDRCAAVFLPSGEQRPPMPGAKAAPPQDSSRESEGKEVNDKETKGKAAQEEPPPQDTLPRLSQRSLFLALYAKYMSGEKKREESTEMILGPQDKASVENQELVVISSYLEKYFSSGPKRTSEGWLEYLYGVVLAKGKNDNDAKDWLVASVNRFPYNWSAWLELNDLLDTLDDLRSLVPRLRANNLMTFVFGIYASQMLYHVDPHVVGQLEQLEACFPASLFIKTQRALLAHHAKDDDEAEAVFDAILQADPHRLDALDHYSNILHVKAARPKLAFLAQLAAAVDKFRPETCCIVGNYYALKSEHEKAVSYFRRALTLDRGFLSAWILMGHEFVEMKNTHAAIESYRRAVDANRKDFRAWYGLGQTYEVLEMHLYALFYYQRAAALRPGDHAMWRAVGRCFDVVGRPRQGIQAYKRALVAASAAAGGDPATSSFTSASSGGAAGALDPFMVIDTLYSIAGLYERLGDVLEAARYMELTAAQEDGADDDDDPEGRAVGTGPTKQTLLARMWLARWAFAKGEFKEAMELATELCNDGHDVEEAKALIRDIRARLDSD